MPAALSQSLARGMRHKSWMPLLAVPLCWCASMALADVPQRGGSVTGSVGVASDYVPRGISISDEETSAFGQLNWRNRRIEIAGTANSVARAGATVKLDLAARMHADIGNLEIAASIERTIFPGAFDDLDHWQFGIDARREWSDAIIELGLATSPDNSGGAHYAFLGGTMELFENSFGAFNAKARVGWRRFDDNEQARLSDYRHWRVGFELLRGAAAFEVEYHDTNLPAMTPIPADSRIIGRFTYRFSQAP